MTRQQTFAGLDGARDEFLAARFCLAKMAKAIQAGQALLPTDPATHATIRNCQRNLEATYSLRLFAEFEFVLRDYLHAIRPSPQPRRTKMEHLMNRIAANRGIPFRVIGEAHQVREQRNATVHAKGTPARLTFDQCKSRLATFLSYLPPDW